MTTVERIERYGVEAWEEKKRKDREYYQANKERIAEYRQTHKEQKKEYNKEYYQANKERITEQKKDYYQANKERRKEYNQANKERIAERAKNYYQIHKERKKEYNQANKERGKGYQKKYYSTPLGKANNLARTYKRSDRKKGFDPSNNVTSKWIIENIFSGQSCIYCGDSDWTHLGCDRIDNSKPHTPDNVICSCGLCNIERNDKCSVEEFKQYRALHPRDCDISKAPAFILSSTGALKKKTVR